LVNGAGDQAEGLRQILAFSRARTIAVVAGTRGAGATTCVVNLACALTAEGKRVLVIDENSGANVSNALSLTPGGDLHDVMTGARALEEVLLDVAPGVRLLPAGAAAHALPLLDQAAQQRAIASFASLDAETDVVLLDANNEGQQPSAFARAAQEVIVVVCPGPSSVTGGYAAIKRMTRAHGRARFRLLVNRASDPATAALIHENMAQVAAKHLDTAVQFMGAVPHDASVPESTRRGSAVVQMAPASGAGHSFIEHAANVAHWAASRQEGSRLDHFMERAIHGSRLGLSGAGA
jgi:flagellar biosynthesis protein FlhG